MPSSWTKQNVQLTAQHLNSGAGDSVLGGAINSVPYGANVGAGNQNRPGDHVIFGEEDIGALDDPAVGTLYGGMYQYVQTKLTATALFTRARAVFWDVAVAAANFQVTSDESGAQGVNLFAGVLINNVTAGNYWWIQTAGRVSVQFRLALTGVPTDGCPVYLAGVGAGVDVGEFDVLDGGAAPTFTQVGQMLARYVGIAQGIPVADTASTIDLALNRNFRW